MKTRARSTVTQSTGAPPTRSRTNGNSRLSLPSCSLALGSRVAVAERTGIRPRPRSEPPRRADGAATLGRATWRRRIPRSPATTRRFRRPWRGDAGARTFSAAEIKNGISGRYAKNSTECSSQLCRTKPVLPFQAGKQGEDRQARGGLRVQQPSPTAANAQSSVDRQGESGDRHFARRRRCPSRRRNRETSRWRAARNAAGSPTVAPASTRARRTRTPARAHREGLSPAAGERKAGRQDRELGAGEHERREFRQRQHAQPNARRHQPCRAGRFAPKPACRTRPLR